LSDFLKVLGSLAIIIPSLSGMVKGCSTDNKDSQPPQPPPIRETTIFVSPPPVPPPMVQPSPIFLCLKDSYGGCILPKDISGKVEPSDAKKQSDFSNNEFKSKLRARATSDNGSELVTTLDDAQFLKQIQCNLVLIDSHLAEFSGRTGFEVMANIESLASVIEWTDFLKNYLSQIEQFAASDPDLIAEVRSHISELDSYRERYRKMQNGIF